MGKRADRRKAYVVDAGGRTGQSYRGLQKVPRVLRPPGRTYVGGVRAMSRWLLAPCSAASTNTRGGGACQDGNVGFPIPNIRVSLSLPVDCSARRRRRRFVSGLVARQVGSAASVECRGPSKLLGGVEGWRWHTA